MCLSEHRGEQFSHIKHCRQRGAKRGWGLRAHRQNFEQVRWSRERRWEGKQRESERERECPSNGYTEGASEGAREDLSPEDMSNSRATGSNAWESRQLLWINSSLLHFFYSPRCQSGASQCSLITPAGKVTAAAGWSGLSSSSGSCCGQKC